jgi:phage terminase small subunit
MPRKSLNRALFAAKWVECRDLATAYVFAGGAAGGARQSAFRLIREPEVKRMISEITRSAIEKANITAERTVLELARVGYADLRNLFDDNGRIKAPHELDDDTAAAIAGIDIEERTDKDGNVTRSIKIRRSDKNQALSVLARYQKLIGGEVEDAMGAALAVAERMEKARARLKRMRAKPP